MSNLVYFLLVLTFISSVLTLNLPGPLVYVVTPAPKSKPDAGRSAPFYYHNWMRRMDTPRNVTTTTTTTTTTQKTPDLIFAEFESDKGDQMRKSIRKLLEKERIGYKTTTTSKPIYVPDEIEPAPTSFLQSHHLDEEKTSDDTDDYFAMYNNAYKIPSAPTYLPSTTSSPATQPTTTTTTSSPIHVENIWHIIDNEKYNHGDDKWEELPQSSTDEDEEQKKLSNPDEGVEIDDNFALPGFATNTGNGAENESRAIRNEPQINFPYVNLKTFQMKNPKKQNSLASKKGNNMFMNLDNFHEVNHPVRGESQDVTKLYERPIDRYNPAQPYLPGYGTKSKVSDPTPVKAVGSLAPPPPPPPPPPSSGNDFPFPSSYESFPPYAPSGPVSLPAASKPPSSQYQPPPTVNGNIDDSTSDSDDGPPIDLGYRYKAPLAFVPTLPPPDKPMNGYSPSMDSPPPADTGYSYKAPMDGPPSFSGYSYSKPMPSPPEIHDKPSYGPQMHGGHDHDYPELIYDKPHGGHGDMKGGNDMKGNDMGMMPPPPPDAAGPDGPPDHGFPHDFPTDLKFHHDFDDHDFYHDHHYHHHPTTTTSTTEMPRVNRYSYYYLGKKLYYLPLYFSVYFIVYVGALIIKAVLRHKIVYPNSWRPNDQTATFFSKRSVDSWDLSNDRLHEVTGIVTKAISTAAEKYMNQKPKTT